MQSELYSISKLFTDNLFRIPDYQRGYSWTDKQLKDFWNDINQISEGRNHYTGVITLEEVPTEAWSRWDDDLWIIESKRFSPYYVVDGQQRLTTIIVLLTTIIESTLDDQQLNYTDKADIRKRFIYDTKDGGISRSYIFGYEKDNPSYNFLKHKIFLEDDADASINETIYTHNLRNAKHYFAQKLKNLQRHEIERIYTVVTQKLLINIYTITKEVDVFVAFETMNNRGKPLSNLELLKNRLIFLSTRSDEQTEEKSRLRKVINDSWKIAYHYLGKNKSRPLDDDYFLFLHFNLYFPEKARPVINHKLASRRFTFHRMRDRYKDIILDDIFTLKNVNKRGSTKVSIKSIHSYAKHLENCVKAYYEINDPAYSEYSDEEKIFLERVRRITNPDTAALCIAAYSGVAPVKPDTLRLLTSG